MVQTQDIDMKVISLNFCPFTCTGRSEGSSENGGRADTDLKLGEVSRNVKTICSDESFNTWCRTDSKAPLVKQAESGWANAVAENKRAMRRNLIRMVEVDS